MRALTVQPGRSGTARLDDLPEPTAGDGELLVDGLALGVCGTDREIATGAYGWAPPGRDRLVLGHESLGRVRQAPPGSEFAAGDLVVGVVRRPDPGPCGACAHGEFDMCRTGDYTERGIKQRDGYAAEAWALETAYAVKQIVLENDVVVGSVNANLRHYHAAAEALARADLDWLESLITRRVPLEQFADALTARDDDIKVVLTLTDGGR